MAAVSSAEDRILLLQEFYKDILDQKNYIPDRRRVLRQRAGIRDKDSRVPPWSFVDRFCTGDRIREVEVQKSEANQQFLSEFLAQFCEKIPNDSELEEALTWASMTFCLNPQLSSEADHRAWASIESGVQHALASYCMTRFQRSPHSRTGREAMAKIKNIIHAKLKACELLTKSGKKKPSRGPQAKKEKEETKEESKEDKGKKKSREESEKAVDNMETVPYIPDTQDLFDCGQEKEEKDQDEMSEDEGLEGETDEETEEEVESPEEDEEEVGETGKAEEVHEDEVAGETGKAEEVHEDEEVGETCTAEEAEETVNTDKVEEPKGQDQKAGEQGEQAEPTMVDTDQEDDEKAAAFADTKGPIAEEHFASKELEEKAEQAAELVKKVSNTTNDDIVRAQRKMRQTVKEAQEEEDSDGEDDDRRLRELDEESDEKKRGKGRGRGRARGRGKGRGRGKKAADCETEKPDQRSRKRHKSDEDEEQATDEAERKKEDEKPVEKSKARAHKQKQKDNEGQCKTKKTAATRETKEAEEKTGTEKKEAAVKRDTENQTRQTAEKTGQKAKGGQDEEEQERANDEQMRKAPRRRKKPEEEETKKPDEKSHEKKSEDQKENVPKKRKKAKADEDEGRDKDEKTKAAGTEKPNEAERMEKAEEKKKRKHAIATDTEKTDEGKTRREKDADRQSKVEDKSKEETAKKRKQAEERDDTAGKGGMENKHHDGDEVHEIKDEDSFSPEKPDNQLGDEELNPPTPAARPCEDKSTENAHVVSEKPKTKSQAAKRKKAKQEGEGPKSESKKSPLKLAASASRRMMEKKKNGDGVAKNLAEEFERMADKGAERNKPKRVVKPMDTTDLATSCTTLMRLKNEEPMFSIPDDLQTAMDTFQDTHTWAYPHKSFTLTRPDHLPPAPVEEPGTIGVLLDTRGFFASRVPKERIELVNDKMNPKPPLNANVRRGVSVSWGKYGPFFGWSLATALAGWTQIKDVLDSEEEDGKSQSDMEET